MNEVAQVITVLLIAAYWGGAVFVDFVVTPARFRTPKVDRKDVNAIGRQIFLATGFVQGALATAAILTALIGGADLVAVLSALFLTILAGAGLGILFAMDSVRDPSRTPEEIEADADTLKSLHRAAFAIDIFKIVLGAILLAVLVTQ